MSGILAVTGAEDCKEYVRQASGILPISWEASCLHSGYCAGHHGACRGINRILSIVSIHINIELLGAEKTKVTTVEAPVRCARVYELLHRKTKHENEF